MVDLPSLSQNTARVSAIAARLSIGPHISAAPERAVKQLLTNAPVNAYAALMCERADVS